MKTETSPKYGEMRNPPRSPSVKALRELYGDKAPGIKRILRMNRASLMALPAGDARVRECHHEPALQDLRMTCLNAECETFGVEGFQIKNGDWVEYLNTGDTYEPTICRINGAYRIACWGDIVEKHGSFND
jgi:hypothetical protein